jgi:AmmeMemoRadiSam system protein B
MPSPIPDQPGLVIRDPFHYSDVTLVIPPLLARCLPCFDGVQDEADLRALLARLTRQVAVAEPARRLVAALRDAGFLDDDRFVELRDARERAFAEAAERAPAHAGSGYPSERPALVDTLDGYFRPRPPAAPRSDGGAAAGPLVGIAAPHASPEGGRASYAAAYRALPRGQTDRVFVLLGTSHYGEPDRFGLTRKPFATPFGNARTERALVDELASRADGAVTMEDYCHSVEHSLEFQVVFLQHLYGPDVRIVPVLCGAFYDGPRARKPPEHNDHVARFLDTLGDMAAREGERLCFVLGVDFAHVGRRYGDELPARAHQGAMDTVERRDRERLERVAAGDATGFWDLVSERGEDDLKWCGSSPLYTFLRAIPRVRGRLLAYEHWNIDDASVVSFGALSFSAPEKPRSRG